MSKKTQTPVDSSPLLPETFCVKIPKDAENLEKLKNRLADHPHFGQSRKDYLRDFAYVGFENGYLSLDDCRTGPLISLDKLLNGKFPFVDLGEWESYEVRRKLSNGNIHIGCQVFSPETLNKVFNSLNKNTVFCDLFEDKDKVLIILPEKKQIWVCTSYDEPWIYDIEGAEKLKALIKGGSGG